MRLENSQPSQAGQPLNQKQIELEARTLEKLGKNVLDGGDGRSSFAAFHKEVGDLAKEHGLKAVRDVFKQMQSDSKWDLNPMDPSFTASVTSDKGGLDIMGLSSLMHDAVDTIRGRSGNDNLGSLVTPDAVVTDSEVNRYRNKSLTVLPHLEIDF